jgi:signal transduction histidine kinase
MTSKQEKGDPAAPVRAGGDAVVAGGAFSVAIAAGIRAAHVELAARWLRRLRELLPVPATAVFPTASLLDHIPDLIEQIAADLASPGEHPLVANTTVIAKAQELGELRYRQHASVHQLLREYRLLADVLSDFVGEEIERLRLDAHASECLTVAARLHAAVFLLMQHTVDTFVARYAATVANQTARLEGFNRMVTHELRQPLGTIRSAAMLLGHPDVSQEIHARGLEIIESNSRRMATLTTRLLTLSSLEVDSLQTQEADLSMLVNDSIGQLEEMAASRQVEMAVHVPPVRIVTDIARVDLILVNLVSNAIKYSDPGKARRFVEISAVEEEEHVLLSVADNGVGVPAADLGRVFDGFYRAHAARDGELGADGLGLGLAIAAECARHIGATLGVSSDGSNGATFTVRLPRQCAVAPFGAPGP